MGGSLSRVVKGLHTHLHAHTHSCTPPGKGGQAAMHKGAMATPLPPTPRPSPHSAPSSAGSGGPVGGLFRVAGKKGWELLDYRLTKTGDK